MYLIQMPLTELGNLFFKNFHGKSFFFFFLSLAFFHYLFLKTSPGYDPGQKGQQHLADFQGLPSPSSRLVCSHEQEIR